VEDRLVTRSFICILAANFLLYFGFWLLVPVLPFYLKETFSCGEAAVGTILSCYTVSALCTRPFMGYLYDGFARKPIYIMAYLLFTAIFAGYVLTSFLTVFILPSTAWHSARLP
jgi:MFS family permease